MRLFLHMSLAAKGFRPIDATTGGEALTAARTHNPDVNLLDAGADDDLTKPFGAGELLARIRSALRRAVFATSSTATTVVEVEGVKIDLQKRVVTRDGREVHLTPNEYNVLALLANNAGKVMTHGEILREVWGPRAVNQTHVRVQLREKLERDPAQPAFLITEPGIGYRLRM